MERRVLREKLRKDMIKAPSPPNLVEQTGGAIPVVGRPQVCGAKVKNPVKIIERPPHDIPPATWHLNPDLEAMESKGPLTGDQLKRFHQDGYLLIPEVTHSPGSRGCSPSPLSPSPRGSSTARLLWKKCVTTWSP